MADPRIERYVEDSLGRRLPELTPRHVPFVQVAGRANVVIGMRRSGKTYILFEEMQRIGAPADTLYVNFEDDRLGTLVPADLDALLETFFRLRPAAREKGAWLFFDEIQAAEGWSRFVRRVLDTERARVFLSGSSAKMLSTEVATEFRGRSVVVEVMPFSFVEAARHAGLDLSSGETGAVARSRLEALSRRYLEVGGFPEVQKLDVTARIGVLQDLVELVLMRDVVERHRVANAQVARLFARTLLRTSGRTFSVNKVYRDFKSRGLAVSKDGLHALLAHFEDAFLAFAVPVFARSTRVRETNPRKLYAVDPGLAFAMSHVGSSDVGQRLETTVYLELRRRAGRSRDGAISYYSTHEGLEVDFVVGDAEDEHAASLVQVCADLSGAATREREMRATFAAMKELHLSRSTLVTLTDEGVERQGKAEVRIVPAWRWLSGL